jgi:predicted MFS family arabinose efflux permease
VCRGVLHGVLAVLILTGEPAVWLIALIEALFGIARAFFQPAYTGLIPQTVPEHLVGQAQATTALSGTVAGTLGPGVGALLIVTVGAGTAFAIDAGTFFVSAALLLRVRARDRGGERKPRAPALREIADGFGEIRARPWTAWIIGWAAIIMLVGYGPHGALGPAIADDVYGRDAVFGVILSVSGAGTVIGAALALRWEPERPAFSGMIATLPWVCELLFFALGTPLPAMLAVSLSAGVAIGLFDVWWETAVARSIPPAALSRFASVDWMGSLALLPIGFALAGPLGEAFGPRSTLGVGGVVALAMTLLVISRPAVRAFSYPKSGTPAVGVEASP